MKCYIVTLKLETIGTVSAKTYAEAGTKAAKLVNRGKGARGLVGIRVTGDQDKSGVFQGYVPVPQRLGSGQHSFGLNFHLREI